MGHVDICYQGKVISYGSYDPHWSVYLVWLTVFCLRSIVGKYIELCKRESHKTLFAYLSLTDQQKAAIQARLVEIEDLLIPWNQVIKLMKRREGEVKHTTPTN